MKKYKVTLYYNTFTTHKVEAESEGEAIQKALEEQSDFSEIADNLDLENDFDVWEIDN